LNQNFLFGTEKSLQSNNSQVIKEIQLTGNDAFSSLGVKKIPKNSDAESESVRFFYIILISEQKNL